MVASKDRIEIHACDETYVQVVASCRGVLQNLSEYFTYDVPNAKFHPKVKARLWDGKIRLLDYATHRIYKGLLSYIVKYCEDNSIEYYIDDEIFDDDVEEDFDIKHFCDNILNLIHTPYDFQYTAIKHCIEDGRATVLSPTSSGKSLIIYALIRHYIEKCDKKILITVPTVGLIDQLIQEFKDYDPSYDIESQIHKIYSGQEKVSKKKIYISTWQSVYKERKKYFELFDVIMTDEAHQAKADSLRGIYEKARNVKYRFGFTGTLDDMQVHQLMIEGLIGPVYSTVTTKELIDREIVSNLQVNCLVLKYDDEIRKQNNGFKYAEEQKFVSEYTKRHLMIKNVASAIPEGNNLLILTAYREHLATLAGILEKLVNKTVYIVHGDIDPAVREDIRQRAEKEKDVIIVATYGVYSTGINIKNLQYVMFATGSKSQIRVLQSIGRGLRKDSKDNKITILDIVDEFSYKKKKNFLLRHFFERIKIYAKQQFKYKIKYINI